MVWNLTIDTESETGLLQKQDIIDNWQTSKNLGKSAVYVQGVALGISSAFCFFATSARVNRSHKMFALTF